MSHDIFFSYLKQAHLSLNNNEIYTFFYLKIEPIFNFIIKINTLQKEFSLLTNLIFYFLLLSFIIIRKKIVSKVFSIAASLYKYHMKKKENQLVDKANSLIKDAFFNEDDKKKSKKIIDFKKEKQDLIFIEKKITKLSEGSEANIDKVNGKLFFNSENSDCNYLSSKASEYFSFFNPLHPDVFGSIRMVESELIKVFLERFSGIGDDFCGCTTSSPTENVILMLRAYKGYSKKSNQIPEIILPESTCSMYFKTCIFMNINPITVPVDSEGRMKIEDLKRILYKKRKNNIIAVIAFYPNFTFGVSDKINELSELCLSYKIPLHIDGTYGALIGAFRRNASLLNTKDSDKFDFSLKGVTSISTDLSKYGLSPIGVSLLLYRSKDIRKNQYYIYTNFQGGFYATPGLSGSKTAAMIFAAYTNLVYFGYGKYEQQSIEIISTVKTLKDKIKVHLNKNIEVVGKPELSIISFYIKENTMNIGHLYEKMKEKGWDLMIRFKKEKKKIKKSEESILFHDTLTLIVTPFNRTEVEDAFFEDLKSGVEIIEKERKEGKGKEESKQISCLRFISQLPLEVQMRCLKEYNDYRLDL